MFPNPICQQDMVTFFVTYIICAVVFVVLYFILGGGNDHRNN